MTWIENPSANRDHWDQRCESHLAAWYDVDAFRTGSTSLDALQIAEDRSGSIAGRAGQRGRTR